MSSLLITPVALIGGRGAGKTTVGLLLAKHLSVGFMDLDKAVEITAGKSIVEIFASAGEAEFRKLETEALRNLTEWNHGVFATGGGTVLATANRELLKVYFRVIWLNVSPQVAFQRVAADPSTSNRRPDLTPLGGLAEMELVFKQREPLYREVADLAIDTTSLSPEGVVSAILAAC